MGPPRVTQEAENSGVRKKFHLHLRALIRFHWEGPFRGLGASLARLLFGQLRRPIFRMIIEREGSTKVSCYSSHFSIRSVFVQSTGTKQLYLFGRRMIANQLTSQHHGLDNQDWRRGTSWPQLIVFTKEHSSINRSQIAVIILIRFPIDSVEISGFLISIQSTSALCCSWRNVVIFLFNKIWFSFSKFSQRAVLHTRYCIGKMQPKIRTAPA